MRISQHSSSFWLTLCLRPCAALQPFPKLPTPSSSPCRRSAPSRTHLRRSGTLTIPTGHESHAGEAEDLAGDDEPEEDLSAVNGLVIDHGAKSSMSGSNNLNTFYDVLHESDVLATSGPKPRLVDDPAKHHDFDLWTDLLRFRARYKGHEGAWEVFQGMRARGIDLPTEGACAAILWDTIVVAGLKSSKSREIWEYSLDLHARTGRRYPKLYSIIIGYYTPLKWQYALQSHERFRSANLLDPKDLRTLAMRVDISAFRSKRFKKLYEESEDRHLYDLIMTRLYSSRHYRIASMWHFILTSNHDCPSSFELVKPLLQHSKSSGRHEEYERILVSLRDGQDGFKLNTTELSAGDVHLEGIGRVYTTKSSRTVSDQFCARAFATRAFNPSVVIRTMSAFGVKMIGSVSLRELAVRCRDLIQTFSPDQSNPHAALAREVTLHLNQLQAAGIKLEGSKFVKLICAFARESHGALLDAILSSDQHPDVYEDGGVQKRLLGSYIYASDWPQVHRTLAVLTFAHENPAITGWNTLLKAYMHHGPGPLQKKMTTTLSTMHSLKIPVTADTIRHSYCTMLEPWRGGKLPSDSSTAVAQLHAVTRIWLDILQHGSNVPASCWDYILRRYGAIGHYDELERLSLWLAHYYSAKVPSSPDAPHRRHSTVQLNLIFRPMMQRAIAEWYFKSLQWPDRTFPPKKPLRELGPVEFSGQYEKSLRYLSGTETWARGLALLRVLGRLGVRLDTRGIYAACRHRLRILYGGGLSRRKSNRVAMERNPHSLGRMLRYLRHVCRPLNKDGSEHAFGDVPEGALVRYPEGDPREAAAEYALRARMFGSTRPIDKKRRIRWVSRRRTVRMRYMDRVTGQGNHNLVGDEVAIGTEADGQDEGQSWHQARERYYYSSSEWADANDRMIKQS